MRTPGAARRAPRLQADERIGRHFTRLGRFRAIDPTRSRALPRLSRMLAGLSWALLVEESLRRARRQARGRQDR
ncbi:MAG: hypothetical protein WD250_16520 [Egibacteraceae bacterium]